MAEYKYEYYLGSEIWPNTNMNTIRFKILAEYEYYSECHFCPNTNTNT